VSSYKILVFLPIWGRHEITERCFQGLRRLSEYNPHKYLIDIVAVVSEDWAKKLCDKYNYRFVYAENFPLGAKLNTGLEYCMKFQFDYLMTLGSDDFIDNRLLDVYDEYFKQGTELFGTDKICFVQGDKAKMVSYSLTIAGAGRCIKKSVIEKICCNNVKVEYLCSMGGTLGCYSKGDIAYMKKHTALHMAKKYMIRILSEPCVNLWEDERQNALDHNSNMKLITNGASNKCLDIKEPLIVDVKGEDNIWGYDYIEGEEINKTEIKIPELCEPVTLTVE